MFGTMDLQQVLRYQADLRRDAAKGRSERKNDTQEQAKAQPRRVLGLRLSLA
jgi:hypothetical protein